MKELSKQSFLPSVSRILLTFKAKLYFVPLGSSNILPSCAGESGKQLLTLSSPISRPFWGRCVCMSVQTLPNRAPCSGTPRCWRCAVPSCYSACVPQPLCSLAGIQLDPRSWLLGTKCSVMLFCQVQTISQDQAVVGQQVWLLMAEDMVCP